MNDRRGPDGRGPEGPGRGGLMRLLDENHDGRLSRQEFSQAATFFAELDMNRDGSIDPSELLGGPGGREMGPDGRGPRPEGDFRRDGDRPGPDGERMRDGDRPGPRGEGDRGPEGDRPRPDGEGRPGGRPDGARFGNPDDFWKQLDKNGDGGVTKEEAPERMRENFDTIDANKDGKITQDEAREAMERRFGGRGPGGPGGRPGRPEGERRPARPEGEESKPEGDKPSDSK